MKLARFASDSALPVICSADVAVVGGGPGGLGAALMSARCGARTVLVEAYGVPGGMAVIGEVQPFMISGTRQHPLDAPVYGEWKEAMLRYFPETVRSEIRTATDYRNRAINKAAAALAAEDLLLESGVELLYHHRVVDARVENGRIAELVCNARGGFGAIRAKVFVDCTGDGEVAALAGCPFDMGNENGGCQPMTLCFKLSHVKVPFVAGGEGERFIDPEWKRLLNVCYVRAREQGRLGCPREDVLLFPFQIADEGVIHFNTTRVQGFDPTDGGSFSQAEIEGRRQMRELVKFLQDEVPGFENSRLMSMAVQIGVRESRRIRGMYRLTAVDFAACSRFEDVIARCSYNIDIHSSRGAGTFLQNLKPGDFYEIPYRSIVPLGCANLTVGGRPVSADAIVYSSLRIMPTAISIGQGAGVGAALAAMRNMSPAGIDGKEVRRKLIGLGAELN